MDGIIISWMDVWTDYMQANRSGGGSGGVKCGESVAEFGCSLELVELTDWYAPHGVLNRRCT